MLCLKLIQTLKDISQDNILKWKNHFKNNKIKRGKSRVDYYANQIATCNLILAGDIELNPGPGLHPKTKASKCNICDKAVGTNRKRVKCDVCHNLRHVSCLNISKHQQNNFKTRDLNVYFNTQIHDHPFATTPTSKVKRK